jgi:hypothetical protein
VNLCSGQNDIKKLRRENEQLRREIWGLREEYDRLEGLLGKAKRRGQLGNNSQEEDSDDEVSLTDTDRIGPVDLTALYRQLVCSN